MLAWLVTGSHHREVCAQYEARLAAAAERLSAAEERADRADQKRHELEEKLIEHIFPAKPEPRQPRTKTDESLPRQVEVPLDPNDNQALIRQAMKETGSRNLRVILARAQRMKDGLLRGDRVTRTKRVEPMPSLEQVQAQIDAALKEGEQAALAQAKAS
jgi:hypothetical protein